MSDVLRAKLSAVRRKSVFVNAGAGFFMAGGAIIGAIGLGMLVDWLWELPYTVRAALLAIDLSMLVYLAVRFIVWPMLRKPDDDEIALWVEQESPGLKSRLISAVQLTRPEAIDAGLSTSLVRALVRQTEEITAPMDFLGVVKTDRLAKFGGLAALAVVLGSFAMVWGGTNTVDLLKRAMLVPGIEVPRKTRVVLMTDNPLVVARGEPVELRARATGIVPSQGTVWLQYDGMKQWVSVKMNADADHPGQFAVRLETVPESFGYRVVLNDGHSGDARVEAAVRPTATAMDIRQIFPAYTNLPPGKVTPGDMRLLAGSRLSLHVTASKAVKITTERDKPFNRVTLHLKDGMVDFPLTVESNDRKMLVAQMPAGGAKDIPLPADVVGMSIRLVDNNGLETRDPAIYHIELLPDNPPSVRVTYPDRKEQLSTAQAKLVVGVEASDDFALGKVILRYRVIPPELAEAMTDQPAAAAPPPPPPPDPGNAGVKHHHEKDQAPPAPKPADAVESIPFELHGTPKDFRGRFDFELDKLKTVPLEHGAVEWWLEAEDTNTVTGPGKASSDHYLTRIGTEAEVRTELFTRLGNHMGQIKEATETQIQDNTSLGEMIQEKVGTK